MYPNYIYISQLYCPLSPSFTSKNAGLNNQTRVSRQPKSSTLDAIKKLQAPWWRWRKVLKVNEGFRQLRWI